MEFSRKEVLEAVGAQGLAKSKLVIFNALLRLRQICCDLRLLKLQDGKSVPPSPLGGERAGVRGGNDDVLATDSNAQGVTTPHPQSLSLLRGEGSRSCRSFQTDLDRTREREFIAPLEIF